MIKLGDVSPIMVRCLTIGCSGTPHLMSAPSAHALIEYELRRDPAFRLQLECDRCGALNRYSLPAILGMIPRGQRPAPLPPDELWAIVLSELDTTPEMDRIFIGDRVRLKRLAAEEGLDGSEFRDAELRSSSILSPSLKIGDRVAFATWGRVNVCVAVLRDGETAEIDIAPRGRGGITGLFVAPKSGADDLRPANVECANPSCGIVFSLTHSRFVLASASAADSGRALGARPMIIMTCELCGTARCIDESSFDGLAKL